MSPKNVAYTPYTNPDKPKIAERYSTENLVVTKNRVHTHSNRPYLAR